MQSLLSPLTNAKVCFYPINQSKALHGGAYNPINQGKSIFPPINQGQALHGVAYNPVNQCKAFFTPLTRAKSYTVEPIIPLTNAKVCVIPLTSAKKPYMVEPLPGVFLSLSIGKIGFVLVHLHQFLHTCTGTQGKTKPL